MKKLIAALIAGLFATGVFAQASAPAADAAAAPAAEKAAPKAKKAKKHHHKQAAKKAADASAPAAISLCFCRACVARPIQKKQVLMHLLFFCPRLLSGNPGAHARLSKWRHQA
jgi:zona occludens toxin (predicted ATPase)